MSENRDLAQEMRELVSRIPVTEPDHLKALDKEVFVIMSRADDATARQMRRLDGRIGTKHR